MDLSGWTLIGALGICADDQAIVGRGTDPSGQQEAFIATIPELLIGLLLTVGVLGLAAGRRRREAAVPS